MRLDTEILKNHGFDFLKCRYLNNFNIYTIFTGVKCSRDDLTEDILDEVLDTIDLALDEHLVTIAHAAISPTHLSEKPLINAKLEAIDLLSETIQHNPSLVNEICTFVSLLNYYKKGSVDESYGEIFVAYVEWDQEPTLDGLFDKTYKYETDRMLYSRDQFNDFKIMLYEELKKTYSAKTNRMNSKYLSMLVDLLEKMDSCTSSYEKARVINLHKIMIEYTPQEIVENTKVNNSISNDNLDMFIKHCDYVKKYKGHCRVVSALSPLKLKYKNMPRLRENKKYDVEIDNSYGDIDYVLGKMIKNNRTLNYHKILPIRSLIIKLTKSKTMEDGIATCEKSEFYNQPYPLSSKIKLCENIISTINHPSAYLRVHAITSIILEFLKSHEPLKDEFIYKGSVEKAAYNRKLIRTNTKMVSYKNPNKFIIKTMDRNIIDKWSVMLEEHFQGIETYDSGSSFYSKKKWIDQVLSFISKKVENIQYGHVNADEFKYSAMERGLYSDNLFDPRNYKLLKGQTFLLLSEMTNSESMRKAFSYVGNSIIESYNKDTETKFETLVKKIELYASKWSKKHKQKDYLFKFVRPLIRLLETINQTPNIKDKISLIKESEFYDKNLISKETTLLVCEMTAASGYNVYELELMLVKDIIENNHNEVINHSYNDIDYVLNKVVEDNKHKPSHVIEYYKTAPIRSLLIDITKCRSMADTIKVCRESKFYNDPYPMNLKIRLCEDILSRSRFDRYTKIHTATNILLYYLINRGSLETEPEQEPTVEKKSLIRGLIDKFKDLI